MEAGVITNKAKTLHRGQSVATFLMGTRRLYDYVDNNPAVAMYPVDYVNDPYVIAKNDNLVSINSCVQIDIMGQVVSTSAGLRQISGVGGQIDFVRGANMSKGGRAIMAMPSTTGKGKISKIVPFLDQTMDRAPLKAKAPMYPEEIRWDTKAVPQISAASSG